MTYYPMHSHHYDALKVLNLLKEMLECAINLIVYCMQLYTNPDKGKLTNASIMVKGKMTLWGKNLVDQSRTVVELGGP